MHHLRLIYLALITGLLIGCEETTPPPEDINAWLPLRVGTVDIVAQIAISPAEQQKGLMYRKSLPENGGMLFPYPTPRELSFWMANTPLPLDIGFFDAQGTLREIHRLMPYDTNPVRSRGQNLQFALEMPQGWFAKHALFQGQRLDMKLLREAMARRGAKPAEFGL